MATAAMISGVKQLKVGCHEDAELPRNRRQSPVSRESQEKLLPLCSQGWMQASGGGRKKIGTTQLWCGHLPP
jgi:hypothetical protein